MKDIHKGWIFIEACKTLGPKGNLQQGVCYAIPPSAVGRMVICGNTVTGSTMGISFSDQSAAQSLIKQKERREAVRNAFFYFLLAALSILVVASLFIEHFRGN